MSHSSNRDTAGPSRHPSALNGSASSKATNTEWKALLASHKIAAKHYDRWFKWRMLFLLAVALSYLLKLVFFRDIALANFDIPSNREHVVNTYINWRVCSATLLVAVYLFSYVRRWHFSAIAWIGVGVAALALVADYFNVYVMTSTTPPQWMFGLLTLRLLAVVCLLLNAVNARRLPPVLSHRSDWHSLPRG